MDRRDSLKTFAIGFGYTMTYGSMLAFVSGCKSDEGAKESPKKAALFFSEKQSEMLNNFMEAFLPKTPNSPGFKELNLIEAIDNTIAKVYKKEDQEKLSEGLLEFGKRFEAKKDISEFMSQYMSERPKDLISRIDKLKESVATLNPDDKADLAMHNTIDALRGLGIGAYYTSKEIAMNQLAYDPVPGAWIGCQDLSKQPKAWAFR